MGYDTLIVQHTADSNEKGVPMGLFDKKYCDFCGNKIGLLGNKKFEDGNMCKDCASKLSPWFNERRHSTRADLQAQMDSREANKQAAAAFHTTKSLGRYVKLLLDENQRKFMVTSSRNPARDNADVFDYSQATGCDLSIEESKSEIRRKDAEGKSVSYNPPRYEYSYNLYATIHVNHPYVDDMRFSISNGYIKTGEMKMNVASNGWTFKSANTAMNMRLSDYYDAVDLGNEIKKTVEQMMRGSTGSDQGMQSAGGAGREGAGIPTAAAATAAPVKTTCPYCGAPTFIDKNGCCEYCGSRIG